MPVRNILPHNIQGESNDVPKVFKNIDTEDFECTWEVPGNPVKYLVKAGETVTLPKYIVNFISFHLARKIVKREMREAYEAKAPPNVNINAKDYPIRNEAREIELQKEMLAENDIPEEPVAPTQTPRTLDNTPKAPIEPPKQSDDGTKCPNCDFVAKSEFGLKTHARSKHKK